MLHVDSPLKNLPANLDRGQAFFFDGLRHAYEICEVSYSRLCRSLNELSHRVENNNIPNGYAEYYLDAWAFVDSCDKFVSLWVKQPNAETIPGAFSPENVKLAFASVRKIRNIADHLASNKNRLLSLNCAAYGVLSWISFSELNPPHAKTYLISPGILIGELKVKFTVPETIYGLEHMIGHVTLKAGTHTADLTKSRATVQAIIGYLEQYLAILPRPAGAEVLPCDLIAKADVEMHVSQAAT
ncbi:MAG TPA: hypothetical protein VFE72_10415 [Lysobacter sp.]|nr:hypothetical protein [Lysobacter sp.]